MVRIGYWLRKIPDRGVVQVVGQGDAMTLRHLEDFMFAVSVERCPLDRLLAAVAPCEIYRFAAVLDAQHTAWLTDQ